MNERYREMSEADLDFNPVESSSVEPANTEPVTKPTIRELIDQAKASKASGMGINPELREAILDQIPELTESLHQHHIRTYNMSDEAKKQVLGSVAQMTDSELLHHTNSLVTRHDILGKDLPGEMRPQSNQGRIHNDALDESVPSMFSNLSRKISSTRPFSTPLGLKRVGLPEAKSK